MILFLMCRVESFIEHQDACNMGRLRSETQAVALQQPPACLSRTASSRSPSSETNFSTGPNWKNNNNNDDGGVLVLPRPTTEPALLMNPTITAAHHHHESSLKSKFKACPNLDLRLSTTSSSSIIPIATSTPKRDESRPSNHFRISICDKNNESNCFNNNRRNSPKESCNSSDKPPQGAGIGGGMTMRVVHHEEEARGQLRLAMAEKAFAEEARKQAKRQIEVAEKEFANAKRIRQEAQAELDKAYAVKEHAIKQINSLMLQITCLACKRHFGAQTTAAAAADENSLVVSYMSSALTTEGGEEENYDNNNNEKNDGKNSNSLSSL